MKEKASNWKWWEMAGYFFLLLAAGFGISLALINTVKIPEGYGLATKSPHETLFVFGCVILMVIAPLAAGFLRWRAKEFLVACVSATGLLMGNLGFGIALTFLAALIYLLGSKISEVAEYYFPKNPSSKGSF